MTLTILGNMTALAAEPKGTNEVNSNSNYALTSPVDLERLTFTSIKDSILVPVKAFELKPCLLYTSFARKNGGHQESTLVQHQ